MSQIFVSPFVRATTKAGLIAPGAKLYFFLSGTTTPANVYSDDARTTALSNPVIADAFGMFPGIYLNPSIGYRVRLTNSAGTLLAADADPVYSVDKNDIVSAAIAGATAASAADAATALASANAAIIAAATTGVYPLTAATNVPRGAATNVLTAGSGGTNGTNYVATYTGGNYIGNPTILYDVVAGAVANVRLTDPGLYIGSSPTAPTVVLGSGAGGAALTLTNTFRIGTGSGYWVQSADGLSLDRYKNVAGVATADTDIDSIPTEAALAAALASLDTMRVAISETDTAVYGSTSPANGSPGSAATQWVVDIPVTIAGTITQIQFYALAAGTFTIRRWTLSAGVFSYVASSVFTVTAAGAGVQTFVAGVDFTAFDVAVGEYFSFYSTVGLAYAATNANGAPLATAGAGNTTSNITRSIFAGAYFQFGFSVATLVLMDVADRVVALEARPLPFGGPTDNASYYLEHAVDSNGYNQVYSIRKSDAHAFALTSGNFHSIGNLLPSSPTVAGIARKQSDGSIINYTVPIEGGSLTRLHSSASLVLAGDSLTDGTALGSKLTTRWGTKLATATGRTVTVSATSGWTSTQIKTGYLALAGTEFEKTLLVWAGTNNKSNPTTIVNDVTAMIAAMIGASKRYLVMGPLGGDTEIIGTTGYNQLAAVDAALLAAFGAGHWFDVRAYFSAKVAPDGSPWVSGSYTTKALIDAALSPTSDDLTDITNGLIPRALRVCNGSLNFLHIGEIANEALGTLEVPRQLASRGW